VVKRELVLRKSVDNILKHMIIMNLSVHFALMQNEPKDQGCEGFDGGRGISATFYQWSTTSKACKIDFGRYDKRYPQIFQLPQSANYFKARTSLETNFDSLIALLILIFFKENLIYPWDNLSCRFTFYNEF